MKERIRTQLLSTRYGMGEFGFTFFLMFIAYHLMFFMTDVLQMPVAIAAVVYAMVQWFEGITMFLSGILIDKATSRGGGYCKWMLSGAVLCAVFTTLTFCDFHLSVTATVITFSLFYLLAYIGYNLMWVSYRSMIGPLSSCAEDNVRFTTRSAQLGTIAGLLFSAFGTQFLYGFASIHTGYILSALVCGIVMIIGILISTQASRPFDRKAAERKIKATRGQVFSFREMLQTFNMPLVILFAAISLRESVSVLLPSLLVYYFRYVMGDATILSTYLVVYSISTLVGQFITQYTAVRFGKHRMFCIASAVAAGILFCLRFTGTNVTAFLALISLYAFTSTFSGTMIPAFMNEIADYNEIVRNVRTRSFVISIGGTAIRASNVIGGALASFGLLLLHYESGMEATPEICSGLTNLISIGSAACALAAMAVFLAYPLKDRYMKEIYCRKASGQSVTVSD